MPSKSTCYCGSGLSYQHCCKPLICGDKAAQTPEQLMRSRFSAYATKAYQYIFDTYAKDSQASLSIADLQDSAQTCYWVALVIHHTTDKEAALTNESEQFVEFSAFYIEDDCLFEMREQSRFVQELVPQPDKPSQTQWRYIDGEIMKHSQLEQLNRNQVCPCNNYPSAWPSSQQKKVKKYKHCCAKGLAYVLK